MLKKNSYILVRQANPEREAVGLGEEIHVCALIAVVDARQVATAPATLFQSLVPAQRPGQDLI